MKYPIVIKPKVLYKKGFDLGAPLLEVCIDLADIAYLDDDCIVMINPNVWLFPEIPRVTCPYTIPLDGHATDKIRELIERKMMEDRSFPGFINIKTAAESGYHERNLFLNTSHVACIEHRHRDIELRLCYSLIVETLPIRPIAITKESYELIKNTIFIKGPGFEDLIYTSPHREEVEGE